MSLWFMCYALPAQTPARNLNLKNGLALDGYDPVAYFTLGRAQKGSKEFEATYGGATYYFYTETHRKLFLKNPLAFMPQYGGWCAYAMGKDGKRVSIDPETYQILNGKLYLFYNSFFTNTLTLWKQDTERLHKQADENWSKHYNH